MMHPVGVASPSGGRARQGLRQAGSALALAGLLSFVSCARSPGAARLDEPAAGAASSSAGAAAPAVSGSSGQGAASASAAPVVAAAASGSSGQPGGEAPAEAWGPGLIDSGPCAPHRETGAEVTVHETPVKKLFSAEGYTAWTLRVTRTIDGALRTHCVTVAFPPGDVSSDKRPVKVAGRIDDGWLRAIENTLGRLPWRHLQALRRVVIDERPREHGIASFDRRKSDDGRDGHTIWLHTRLFTETNHWSHGNHGRYWSYHLDVDGETLDDRDPDHTRFSPVLLHEIGHLIAYNVVNGNPANEAVPACAKVCGDRPGGCRGMVAAVREQGCVSPYCMPFQFETGTENWAETYRFYFQSEATRSRLKEASPACLAQLDSIDDRLPPPWRLGLPDIADFHLSLWSSCGERPCKAW